MFRKLYIFLALFAVLLTLTAAASSHRHHRRYDDDDQYDTDFDVQVPQQGVDTMSMVKSFLEANKIKVNEITFECTYRCSLWNTCVIKGMLNGDSSNCGPEPANCVCRW